MKFKNTLHICRSLLLLLLIYGLYPSALPDNSCRLSCKLAGLVAVVSIPHKAWIVWELYPRLFGWHAQQTEYLLGTRQGGKERWKVKRHGSSPLFRGVKLRKLGTRQKWRAWRGPPRNGAPRRLSWIQGLDYVPRGSRCQGQRQKRSWVLGELQAFPIWVEDREARSEVGRGREDLGPCDLPKS